MFLDYINGLINYLTKSQVAVARPDFPTTAWRGACQPPARTPMSGSIEEETLRLVFLSLEDFSHNKLSKKVNSSGIRFLDCEIIF